MATRCNSSQSFSTLSSDHPVRFSAKSICALCERAFSSYDQLYSHSLFAHELKLDAAFVCRTCHQICKDQKGLRVHESHTHCTAWSRKRQRCTEAVIKQEQSEEDSGDCDECPVCGEEMDGDTAGRHMKRHDEEVVEAFLRLEEVDVKVKIARLALGKTG